MTRAPASSDQTRADLTKVDAALMVLARLLGDAAAAEMRDEFTTHEDADDAPKTK
ncbi:hypothetical protein LX81_04349 [Palleronia aestuarii]|uniref:Uncharacterized protein n=1 Tax=Palleronia aestuarii TaxID=568105 RepID=A0A2W7MNV7_9RHOB|nr:hypothetical protein [Palleronia aestuarii]PZX09945.1 hypothetical protein LX81_04349 [Palleronia aestuarii]